jgi:glycosyltransferase involved in cell wall biosynthesis
LGQKLTTPSKPTVHILLASYQGEAYLAQQLESIAAQTYDVWHLWVSDDGSTDKTREIVAQFASLAPQRVELLDGPCKGVTQNFFHLINSTSLDNPESLYAFCDQDDVWLPQKIAVAVAQYQSQRLSSEQPYLYCGRTEIVDENLRHIGHSAIPMRPLGFGNALLQNIAGGNTMVFNSALLNILLRINPLHSVLHDWSAYQVATGCGGVIHFDVECCLLYRQHALNQVGVKSGLISLISRLKKLCHGQNRSWNCKTEKAMMDIQECLTLEAVKTLRIFNAIRLSPSKLLDNKPFANKKLWYQKKIDQYIFGLSAWCRLQ